MIRYLYADQLAAFPLLAKTMFRDRAWQFKERQGWDVTVDANGEERDEYDAMNPLYVIYEREDGTHGGSMRFLPTVGQTMVNDHFSGLTDGVRIESPLIWECTRYCLAPGAGGQTAAALLFGGLEMGLRFGLSHFVGVFDAKMIRVYRALDASPVVLGSSGTGRGAISVGLWPLEDGGRRILEERSGLATAEVGRWFEASFRGEAPRAGRPAPVTAPRELATA